MVCVNVENLEAGRAKVATQERGALPSHAMRSQEQSQGP